MIESRGYGITVLDIDDLVVLGTKSLKGSSEGGLVSKRGVTRTVSGRDLVLSLGLGSGVIA